MIVIKTAQDVVKTILHEDDCVINGPLVIHADLDNPKKWSVSHIRTGMKAIGTKPSKNHSGRDNWPPFDNLDQAKFYVQIMLSHEINFDVDTNAEFIARNDVDKTKLWAEQANLMARTI